MDIEGWREKIDVIDCELVALLNNRATAAREIGRIKQRTGAPIYEPRREEIILENVSKANQGPLAAKDLHYIFQNIIAVMRAFQTSEPNAAHDFDD
ncbi:MAG: chorismate mutase [Acidobacteriaceae bacterium]|nr:chorismate mutase [Acidobacteriaceae bacterium]MBV9781483.1 chorismate mutase [Acidobacteriaceae bacterium]